MVFSAQTEDKIRSRLGMGDDEEITDTEVLAMQYQGMIVSDTGELNDMQMVMAADYLGIPAGEIEEQHLATLEEAGVLIRGGTR